MGEVAKYHSKSFRQAMMMAEQSNQNLPADKRRLNVDVAQKFHENDLKDEIYFHPDGSPKAEVER